MVKPEFRELSVQNPIQNEYNFIELFHAGMKRLLSKRRGYFVNEC